MWPDQSIQGAFVGTNQAEFIIGQERLSLFVLLNPPTSGMIFFRISDNRSPLRLKFIAYVLNRDTRGNWKSFFVLSCVNVGIHVCNKHCPRSPGIRACKI